MSRSPKDFVADNMGTSTFVGVAPGTLCEPCARRGIKREASVLSGDEYWCAGCLLGTSKFTKPEPAPTQSAGDEYARIQLRRVEGRINDAIGRLRTLEIRISLLSQSKGEDDSLAEEIARKSPTVRAICLAVAATFKIDPGAIIRSGRSAKYVVPRQVVFYLCRETTQMSLQQIANSLGKFHYSTVWHGIGAVASRRKKDRKFDALVKQAEAEIENVN